MIRKNRTSPELTNLARNLQTIIDLINRHGGYLESELLAKDRRNLICFKICGRTYYPGFQFNPEGQFKPELSQIISQIGDTYSKRRTTVWLTTPSKMLQNESPVDIIESNDPDKLLLLENAILRIKGSHSD